MQAFRSADLQRRCAEVQSYAERAPILLTDYGRPRNVMLSVDEFARLKRAAGEPLPDCLVSQSPLRSKTAPDPLDRDTSDLDTAARRMAENAVSPQGRAAVEVELTRLRARLTAVPVKRDAINARIFVADPASLVLLAAMDMLERLFRPGLAIAIPDMIVEEISRRSSGGRLWGAFRETVEACLAARREHVEILGSPEGQRYAQELELWRLAGSPATLEPNCSGRALASLAPLLRDMRRINPQGPILALADDRDARHFLRPMRGVELVATPTLLRWTDEEHDARSEFETWVRLLTAMSR